MTIPQTWWVGILIKLYTHGKLFMDAEYAWNVLAIGVAYKGHD